MSLNPYQAPDAYLTDGQPGARGRGMFVLAAIGAWLASVYWAGLTALLALGAAAGATSPLQIIMPCVLIVLYAFRGVQLYKGDAAAAQKIVVLHAIGGIMAIIQIAAGNSLVVVLYGIKVAIHVFGGVTAYLTRRSAV
ncbi:MAG: hypothetical protein ABI175_16940 [Polyangiales bacterium]